MTANTAPSLTATLLTSSRDGRSRVEPSAERREREEERTTRYTSESEEREKEAAVSASVEENGIGDNETICLEQFGITSKIMYC